MHGATDWIIYASGFGGTLIGLPMYFIWKARRQPPGQGHDLDAPVPQDGRSYRAIYAIQITCVLIGAVLLIVGHKSLPNAYGFASLPFFVIAAGLKIGVDARWLSGRRRGRTVARSEDSA